MTGEPAMVHAEIKMEEGKLGATIATIQDLASKNKVLVICRPKTRY